MAIFQSEIAVAVAGVVTIGSSPYGSVTVFAEGSTTATFGYLNSAGTFVAFANAEIAGNGAIVLDCGRGTELAVTVVGVPAKIITRGIRNAPGS